MSQVHYRVIKHGMEFRCVVNVITKPLVRVINYQHTNSILFIIIRQCSEISFIFSILTCFSFNLNERQNVYIFFFVYAAKPRVVLKLLFVSATSNYTFFYVAVSSLNFSAFWHIPYHINPYNAGPKSDWLTNFKFSS